VVLRNNDYLYFSLSVKLNCTEILKTITLVDVRNSLSLLGLRDLFH